MGFMKIKEIARNKDGKEFYIYAETAFIHDGDGEYLIKLIDEARKAKCDGIKFQILIENENANTPDLDNFNDIYRWIFTPETWLKVIKLAKQKNLEVVVLPIDVKAVQFCKTHLQYIDAIEIHSACFNDYFVLKELSTISDIPIMLGVGGRIPDEIDYTLDMLKANKYLILMYGFQSFPTHMEDIDLLKIQKYKEVYNLPVGYADHTRYDDEFGDSLVKYAYVLGARIFEKHITLHKGKKRVDYESAVEYTDILRLREKLNTLITALGENDISVLNEAERRYKSREKQLVYTKDIKAGETITYNCLGFKVSANTSDLEQKDIHKIVGCKAAKNLHKNNVVKSDDILSVAK
jgi:sialic acid synthase SpsE